MKFSNPVQSSAEVSGDSLKKGDLLGDLVIVTPTSYDPSMQTDYGHTTALFAGIIVVDGVHAGKTDPSFAAFGNLGKQLSAVALGENALGRITSGTSSEGRAWFGFDFSSDPVDVAAATAAASAPAAPVEAPF